MAKGRKRRVGTRGATVANEKAKKKKKDVDRARTEMDSNEAIDGLQSLAEADKQPVPGHINTLTAGDVVETIGPNIICSGEATVEFIRKDDDGLFVIKCTNSWLCKADGKYLRYSSLKKLVDKSTNTTYANTKFKSVNEFELVPSSISSELKLEAVRDLGVKVIESHIEHPGFASSWFKPALEAAAWLRKNEPEFVKEVERRKKEMLEKKAAEEKAKTADSDSEDSEDDYEDDCDVEVLCSEATRVQPTRAKKKNPEDKPSDDRAPQTGESRVTGDPDWLTDRCCYELKELYRQRNYACMHVREGPLYLGLLTFNRIIEEEKGTTSQKKEKIDFKEVEDLLPLSYSSEEKEKLIKLWDQNHRLCQWVLVLLVTEPAENFKDPTSPLPALIKKQSGCVVTQIKYLEDGLSCLMLKFLCLAWKLQTYSRNTAEYKEKARRVLLASEQSTPREQKKKLAVSSLGLNDKCRLLMIIAAYGQEYNFFERHADWKGYSAARGVTDASRAQSDPSVLLLKKFYDAETTFQDTKALFIGNPQLKHADKDWFEQIRLSPDGNVRVDLGNEYREVVEQIDLSLAGASQDVKALQPEDDQEYVAAADAVRKFWSKVKADCNKWMSNVFRSGQNSPVGEIGFVLAYNDLGGSRQKIEKEVQVFVALLSKINSDFGKFMTLATRTNSAPGTSVKSGRKEKKGSAQEHILRVEDDAAKKIAEMDEQRLGLDKAQVELDKTRIELEQKKSCELKAFLDSTSANEAARLALEKRRAVREDRRAKHEPLRQALKDCEETLALLRKDLLSCGDRQEDRTYILQQLKRTERRRDVYENKLDELLLSET